MLILELKVHTDRLLVSYQTRVTREVFLLSRNTATSQTGNVWVPQDRQAMASMHAAIPFFLRQFDVCRLLDICFYADIYLLMNEWECIWCKYVNTIQHYNTIPHNTTRYDTIQHNTARYDTIQYNTTQYDTIQHNTTQYSTIQHNTIQHSTIQYNTMQYDAIWHS